LLAPGAFGDPIQGSSGRARDGAQEVVVGPLV